METLSSSAAIVSSSSSSLSFFSPKKKDSPTRLLRFQTSSKKNENDPDLRSDSNDSSIVPLFNNPNLSKSKVQQIMSECTDFSLLGIEDLDAFLEHLKEELNVTEAERTKISNEIEDLTRNHVEGSTQLESDIEFLKCTLDFMSSQVGF